MHASGREDMNVRMLGEGRPFYAELTNPKKICWSNVDLDALAKSIHESAQDEAKVESDALPFENEEEKERANGHKIWTSNWHVVKQYDFSFASYSLLTIDHV